MKGICEKCRPVVLEWELSNDKFYEKRWEEDNYRHLILERVINFRDCSLEELRRITKEVRQCKDMDELKIVHDRELKEMLL